MGRDYCAAVCEGKQTHLHPLLLRVLGTSEVTEGSVCIYRRTLPFNVETRRPPLPWTAPLFETLKCVWVEFQNRLGFLFCLRLNHVYNKFARLFSVVHKVVTPALPPLFPNSNLVTLHELLANAS